MVPIARALLVFAGVLTLRNAGPPPDRQVRPRAAAKRVADERSEEERASGPITRNRVGHTPKRRDACNVSESCLCGDGMAVARDGATSRLFRRPKKEMNRDADLESHEPVA